MKRKDPLLRELEKWTGNRSSAISEQWWVGFIALLLLAIAVMSILIGCTVKAAECKLEWNPAPPAELVTEWRVYRGIELLATVTAPAATVILPDAPCEISVVAVNSTGQSPPATMKVSFITDSESVDMRAWAPLRSYHREFLPGRRFYRTKIETPP